MRKYARLIPASIWMVFIFYLSSIPNLELQGEWSIYDFVLRKIAHLVEYAFLTFLFYWGLQKNLSFKTNLWISLILAILYGISDEIHQYFVPTRDGKVIDVFVDSLGVIIALLLIKYAHDKNHQLSTSDSGIRE